MYRMTKWMWKDKVISANIIRIKSMHEIVSHITVIWYVIDGNHRKFNIVACYKYIELYWSRIEQ